MNDLTKRDWLKLYKNGLITARGIKNWKDNDFKKLNCHVSTTELADQMTISKHRDCVILIDRSVYSVRYYSGCFYPMWHKNKSYNESDNFYRLDKKTKTIVKQN